MTLSELCKKDVIQVPLGANLGRADDLRFDPQTAALEGLVLLGRPRLFGLLGRQEDVFIPWYNAYRFLLQNIKYWETKTGEAFRPSQEKALSSTNVMDRWLLVRFYRIG